MYLSDHFTLEEFTKSRTATKLGIKNKPNLELIKNGKLLAHKVLEPLRIMVDAPIIITSGYRCEELNDEIGGADNSQHIEFKASDIYCPKIPLNLLYQIIVSNLQFDQCIYEFGEWIHVSYDKNGNRNRALIAYKSKEKTCYKKYTGAHQL